MKESQEYKDFTIEPWSNGLELVAGSLNSIASFIIKKKNFACGFAFAVGFLTRMAEPNLPDAKLLDEAIAIVKDRIDNNQVDNLEEYTFEFHSPEFIEVSNPDWWQKSAK